MKKLVKGIFTFLLIIVLLVGGTIGVLAFLIIDNTTFNESYDDSKDFNINAPIHNILVKGMSNVKNEQRINLSLDPLDFDYLLYGIIDSIENDLYPIQFHGSQVTYQEDIYSFEIAASYEGIHSVIKLELDFEENNDVFYMYVKDVKLGKLSLINGLLTSLLNNIDNHSLITSLENQNIYCDIDLSNLQISISQDDLYKMIEANLKDNKNYPLIDSLLDIYKENKYLYEIETQNSLNLSLNLQYFQFDSYNSSIVQLNLNTIEESIESLLKENVINTSQVSPFFDFLLNGYNPNQNYYGLDFNKAGFDNPQSWEGVIIKDHSSIEEHIENLTITPDLLNQSLEIKLDENIINSTIYNSDFIGSSYVFVHDSNGLYEYKNQIGYLVIEDLKINLDRDCVNVDLSINLNGYHLGIHLICYFNQNNGLKLTGEISNISFGNFGLTDTQREKLCSYIDSIVDEKWFSVDGQQIILDFEELILNNDKVSYFLNNFPTSSIQSSIENNYIKYLFQA